MFVAAASVLVLLAAAFVAWPWFGGRSRSRGLQDRGLLLRSLYRDRLAEINSETAAGQIAEGERQQLVDELGANLLDEYREGAASERPAALPQPAGRTRPSAAWLALLLLPLAAVAVYLSVGEPDAGEVAGAVQVLRLDPATERGAIERWQDRLERRVARRPGDAQSWYLLGVTRLQLGAFQAAVPAFATARDLAGADPTVDLYWLQARYLAGGGAFDEEARTVAARILESQPNHPLVLEMFAIDAFHRADYRAATEMLNRALNNPLPIAQRDALLAGLEQARQRMAPLQPSVDVAVSAAGAVPEDATVFILARPTGGGMPYAVVRRPASMLPLTVRLDDTTSMSPAARLSDAAEFEVVVRLSRSGRPTAAPGDWEWRSSVFQGNELAALVQLEAVLAPPGQADAPAS